jgi:hypothetical protein
MGYFSPIISALLYITEQVSQVPIDGLHEIT